MQVVLSLGRFALISGVRKPIILYPLYTLYAPLYTFKAVHTPVYAQYT